MASSNHQEYDTYVIQIKYEWIGSPAQDYTLKVYSKFNNSKIYDSAGHTS